MILMMQEEKAKLLAEIHEAVNRRKLLINSNNPETGFENLLRK